MHGYRQAANRGLSGVLACAWAAAGGRRQDEKVVDPARKINWTSKDIQTFLDGVLHAFARLEAVEAPTRDRLLPSFERFIVVVRAISTHMYQFGAAAS